MQACLGVAGGMLTLGGIRTHDRTAIHEIWMLKNVTSKWDVIGKMHFTSKPNIAIQINGEITMAVLFLLTVTLDQENCKFNNSLEPVCLKAIFTS